MSSYRDDRSALKQRLEELEEELAELRDDGKREQVQAQLEALTKRVAEATAQLDEERGALEEVTAALGDLRKAAGLDQPPKKRAVQPAASQPGQPVVPAGDGGKVATQRQVNTILVVFGVAVLLILVIVAVLVGGDAASPIMQRGEPESDELASVPGAPHAVDPVAVLPLARSQAKVQGELVRIVALRVGDNGLVDLDAPSYQGWISYTFQETTPAPAPDPSVPVGVLRPAEPSTREARVRLDKSGIRGAAPTSYPAALARLRSVDGPTCTPARVWQAARKAGAPAGAVATLTYRAATSTDLRAGKSDPPRVAGEPVWELKIEGTSFKLLVADKSCDALP
ncbi:MAG: hypothetical protein JRI68_03115 [Deltaproteobacteria bacterium]|nr:hypothetical protein [Deltaproteobacteria bacterium]